MSTKNTIIELPAQFLSQLMRESFYYLGKDFPLVALKWEWNTLTFAATDSYKVLRFSTATPGEAPIGQGHGVHCVFRRTKGSLQDTGKSERHLRINRLG